MKKLFRSLFALAFGALAFTSCEDVPQPYDTPSGDDPTPVEGEYLNEPFSTEFGAFEVVTTKGVEWMIDFSTAKASGYNSTDKTNTESQSFLVSPNVDLSKSEGAFLEFEYIFRYKSNEGRDAVLITDEYTGDPTTTVWKDITGDLVEGTDWNTFSKYSVNIPSEYIGQPNVRIALYYDASVKSSRTWEVKNLKMLEGTGETDVTPADFDLNGTGGGGGTDPTGKGSYEDPYTVTDAIAKGSATGVYVKGYIVGFVNGQKLEEGATFSADGATETNILIAASPSETSVANCMPVQLPKGTIRDKINLSTNPANLKKEVLLYGDIATYFNVPGVKNTTYAEINGQAIGTKPGGGGEQPLGATYELYSQTNVVSGTYIIATPVAGSAYAVAKPVDAAKNYGWLYVEQADFANNQITCSADYEFTITVSGNYFLISDKSGRFYYMDGTFNSFNVAQLPEGTLPNNYLWDITDDGNYTKSIKNVDKQKTVQYSPDHSSYGAYAEVDKQLPVLLKKK